VGVAQLVVRLGSQGVCQGGIVGLDLVGGSALLNSVKPSEQLTLGLLVPTEQRHGQLGQPQFPQLLVDHLEGLVLLRGDQHSLAGAGQVTGEVGDGQALARARRPFDADDVGGLVFDGEGNTALSPVGWEGEDYAGRVDLLIGDVNLCFVAGSGHQWD
jgi:hypothetical protein